jgi:Ca2+-binding EF-hand superfamily protein
MMNHRTLLAATAALVVAGCTSDTPPSTGVPSFADLDTDGDGFLTPAETAEVPMLADIFKLADADQNGGLSVAEFSQATIEGTTVSSEAAGGPLFTALDRDGNGMITVAEADSVPTVRDNFESFDRDGNGTLSGDEYRDAMQRELSRD